MTQNCDTCSTLFKATLVRYLATLLKMSTLLNLNAWNLHTFARKLECLRGVRAVCRAMSSLSICLCRDVEQINDCQYQRIFQHIERFWNVFIQTITNLEEYWRILKDMKRWAWTCGWPCSVLRSWAPSQSLVCFTLFHHVFCDLSGTWGLKK